MILILSSPRDEHATVVRQQLVRIGARPVLLDLSEFPRAMRLAMSFEDGARAHSLRLQDGAELPLSQCRAIWWRRPQSFVLHPEIRRPAHQNFAFHESYEAFAGLWQGLDVLWMNHPTRDEVAARKAYQLRVAQDVGLRVPRTLITNDPEEARRFIGRNGARVIYKAFSATEQTWRETRLLKEQEVALLDAVRYAPVIFQEYVEAGVDLRVTVVGDQIFPAAIHSQESSYGVDFRMDMDRVRVEAAALPEEVRRGLLSLMQRLGLAYGAADLRRTPQGEHVFLEVNPSGQWLFIEQRTGQPITAAVAAFLAAG